MNPYILCFILFLQIYPKLSQTLENNGNKLGDVLKNHTKSIYNSTKNQDEEENVLKQETHKLLSECGVESDNSYDDDDSYGNRRENKRRGNNYDNLNNRRRPNKRYNGNESNNYNRYGNPNRGNNGYSGDDDENNSNESTNRNGNRRNNGNRNRYNNENYSDEENSNESNQSNQKRYNRTMSNTGYYYGDGGYHNECNNNHGYRNQWRPFGGNAGYDYSNMRRGYGRNFDMTLRAKRSNNDNDDSQCVSQCVFGYLEVLDDNRVPSETLVIKWLQDHLSNDMKRIRALREARRCFARLSTSDTEDGCEFSQSLSKCLNLELE